MKRFLRLLACVFVGIGLAASQIATVTGNVSLRPAASSDNDPIAKLTTGARVELIEPDSTSGCYHVRTKKGQNGRGGLSYVVDDAEPFKSVRQFPSSPGPSIEGPKENRGHHPKDWSPRCRFCSGNGKSSLVWDSGSRPC